MELARPKKEVCTLLPKMMFMPYASILALDDSHQSSANDYKGSQITTHKYPGEERIPIDVQSHTDIKLSETLWLCL